MAKQRLLTLTVGIAISSCFQNLTAQGFGPWVHSSTELDVYVGPNSNPTPSGTSPGDPVTSLPAAIALADTLLGGSPTRTGITINVFPGTYALTQALVVPAFGISIEPYRDVSAAPAPVRIDLSGASVGQTGHIEITKTLDTLAGQTGNPTSHYTPTELRGLEFFGSNETFIRIDPSAGTPAVASGDVVEVGIFQCKFDGTTGGTSNISRAIVINRDSGAAAFYQNRIIGNEINGHTQGILLTAVPSSDLIMHNTIATEAVGIRVNSSGQNNDQIWPRIMSNFIRGQVNGPGIYLEGGSAFIASNSVGFVTGGITLFGAPGSILYSPNTDPSPATLVVTNNILFSPAAGIPELDLSTFGTFPRNAQDSLTDEFNDIDAADLGAGPTTNTGLAASPFVSTTDLHLAAVPASVADLSRAISSASTSITVAGQTVPTSLNIDIDGDSRAHQANGDPTATMHRGADQFVSDGLRLRYSTTAPNAERADAFGNVGVDTNTFTNKVALELDLPAQTQSVWVFYVSGIGAVAPEFEQAFVPPYGLTALNIPSAVSFASTPPGGTTSGTVQVTADYGPAWATSLEAETYIQCFVLRTNGTGSFSNRLRIDIDQ